MWHSLLIIVSHSSFISRFLHEESLVPYFKINSKDGKVVEGKTRTTNAIIFSKSSPISWPFVKIIKVRNYFFRTKFVMLIQQKCKLTSKLSSLPKHWISQLKWDLQHNLTTHCSSLVWDIKMQYKTFSEMDYKWLISPFLWGTL